MLQNFATVVTTYYYYYYYYYYYKKAKKKGKAVPLHAMEALGG
jgi:hypothetical protein